MQKTFASHAQGYDNGIGYFAGPDLEPAPAPRARTAPLVPPLVGAAPRDETPWCAGDQIESAFAILGYNQELVQFADGKANTLILINSIALASTFGLATPIPPEYRSLLWLLKLSFLLASFLAVGLSMAVVLSRIEADSSAHRLDLVFFADMLSRSSFPSYRAAFLRTSPMAMVEDLLSRAWRVAGIAARKYEWYGRAQGVTVVACALWLVFMFLVQCLG